MLVADCPAARQRRAKRDERVRCARLSGPLQIKITAAERPLRDNDEAPTGQVISHPGRLDIGQRDSFGINVQLAASQR
jgi:hypothetical protein